LGKEQKRRITTPTWSTVTPDPYNACCVKKSQ